MLTGSSDTTIKSVQIRLVITLLILIPFQALVTRRAPMLAHFQPPHFVRLGTTLDTPEPRTILLRLTRWSFVRGRRRVCR